MIQIYLKWKLGIVLFFPLERLMGYIEWTCEILMHNVSMFSEKMMYDIYVHKTGKG